MSAERGRGEASGRRPIIAANWKMNKTHLEAIQTVQKLSYLLDRDDAQRVEVVICPPFSALRSVQVLLESDRLPYGLGAQNLYWEDKGALTGEISGPMLAALKCAYVIVGHSERRRLFGESDDVVAKKARAVFRNGMAPIVCVGETLEERDAGRTEDRVVDQVKAAFGGLDAGQAAAAVVAYEPIWAIGTGRNAEPNDAGEVVGLIRRHGEQAARPVRRQRERRERQGVHGPSRDRRRAGRRGQPGSGGARAHREVPRRRPGEQSLNRLLYVCLDGLGDDPIPEFGDLTPLEAARIPLLDGLAAKGRQGLVHTVGVDIAPESDIAVFAILGYDPRQEHPGRGVLEALGAGMRMEDGDLAYRVNFATAEGSEIVDRRVGRDLSSEDAAALAAEVNEKLTLPGASAELRATVEHRGALVFRSTEGPLSANVTNTAKTAADWDKAARGGPRAVREQGGDGRTARRLGGERTGG